MAIEVDLYSDTVTRPTADDAALHVRRPRWATSRRARTRRSTCCRRWSRTCSARRPRSSCPPGRCATRSRCGCTAGPATRCSPTGPRTPSTSRRAGRPRSPASTCGRSTARAAVYDAARTLRPAMPTAQPPRAAQPAALGRADQQPGRRLGLAARRDPGGARRGPAPRPRDPPGRRPPDERGRRQRRRRRASTPRRSTRPGSTSPRGWARRSGAALAGSRDFIDEAWRCKQQMGGAMRQAGIIAAGGVYALRHNVERLAEDHANARRLAEGLADAAGRQARPADGRDEPRLLRPDRRARRARPSSSGCWRAASGWARWGRARSAPSPTST